MKTRPILFSGAMVRALLDGSKTMTRRVIKPDWYRCLDLDEPDDVKQAMRTCPYGVPGDRLWVRETWAHYQTVNHIRRHDGAASSQVSDGLAGYRADGFESIEDFRAHVRQMSGIDLEDVLINGDRWRPSIHMPRWACRLTLEVTEMRVERVQAIGEYDACCEGALQVDTDAVRPGYMAAAKAASDAGEATPLGPGARERFQWLWDSLNEKRGFGWKLNPWVWAVTFRRVDA